MDELKHRNIYIRVKRKSVPVVSGKFDKIRRLFSVRLSEVTDSDQLNPSFVYYSLKPDVKELDDSAINSHLISKVQSYVDSFNDCLGVDEDKAEAEGEDSSYDSDAEIEISSTSGHSHHDVSRTVSDTLAAEYADYVSTPHSAYVAKVEFALKLGYTERHVQAALQKLGPNPGQNELLAELIKLGAQASPKLGSDSDSLLNTSEDSECCPTAAAATTAATSESPFVGSSVNVVSESETLRFRPVVVDGSNVAMSHGNKEVFSCRGIKLCVDWFRARGHKEITVFVPKWRKEAARPDNPITDQEILNELERERLLVFTPSRLVGGKRMICYDDRYILRLAADIDGIVVSNDNYRDLAQENPEFRKVVEERILMYSFVNDRFMPPDDPLGRSGPTLDNFLRIQPHPPPPCPYAKKCTYGNKCKFHHPERGPLPHKSVTERLVEHAQRQLQARGRDRSPGGNQVKGKSLSLPLQPSSSGGGGAAAAADIGDIRKTPLCRTKSNVSVGMGVSICDPQPGLDAFRNLPPGYPVYTAQPAAQPGYPVYPPQPPTGEGASLHRKLQRQLTLNPVCDPRLYQLQRYITEHPSVTRIASAPPAHPSHTVHPSASSLMPRNLTSASDPQLNLSAPPPPLATTWSSCLGPPPPMSACQYAGPSSTDEARCRLHYHLASIFPEEQVQAAMQLYPNETNPQKICAAILAMFPTNQALV